MRISRLLLLAAAGTAISGCATHKYVDDSVADLEMRQGARIEAAEVRLDEVEGTSKEALERAIAAGKLAEGTFLYDVVLQDDAVKFASNKSMLSPDAQDRLTKLANDLKSANENVYLEIQGHTDSTGSDAYNKQLGAERADAVRTFLNMQGVPLNRMATISYGETAPVAPNSTAAGRATNRRVKIVVLK